MNQIDIHGSQEKYAPLFTKNFNGLIEAINIPFCRGLMFTKDNDSIIVTFGNGGFYPENGLKYFNQFWKKIQDMKNDNELATLEANTM